MPDDSRRIEFAGREWAVKSGTMRGPGPNNWSASEQSVWVDEQGWLHLRIRQDKDDGVWYCAEVYTKDPSTYGLHRFHISGQLDKLDPNVVFAPFLYRDDMTEIDIEFTRWGDSQAQTNAQYVVQPFDRPGDSNMERFPLTLAGDYSVHSLDWRAAGIRFQSFQGSDERRAIPKQRIYTWNYTGADIPDAVDGLRVHINLWLQRGNPPLDGQEAEVIVRQVEFPAG